MDLSAYGFRSKSNLPSSSESSSDRAGGTGPVAPVLAGPFFDNNSTLSQLHFLPM